MDKKFALGLITGFSLAALSIIAYIPDLSEAIYSIPPTQAWRTITIGNDAVSPEDGNTTATAINYRDTLHLLTDGSILLNITQVP